MKLSVCMILGRCDDKLIDTFHSIDSIADEICLVQTVYDHRTADAIENFEFTSELIHKQDYTLMHEDGFLRSFAEARNVSFDLATGDMIMWVDADDVVVGPFKLRDEIDRLYAHGHQGKQIDMISMDYDYEFNTDGQCTTRQTRERIVRKDYFKWNINGPIHEVLSPVRKSTGYELNRYFSHIQHNNIQGADSSDRSQRNVTMCKRIVDEGGDQRMNMYYGHALTDVGEYEKAIEQYHIYLKESNWQEERYQVMIRIHNIYKGLGQLSTAVAWCLKAIELFPQYRPAVISIAEVEAMRGDWEKVLHWMRIFGQCEQMPQMIFNPTGEEIQPLMIMQKAYYEIFDWERAIGCTDQLRQLAPEKKEQWDVVESFCRRRLAELDLIKCYETILLNTPEEDHQKIYDAIPDSVADYEAFKPFRTKLRPKSKKIVSIYCGHDDTQAWGPESIKTGIGGSEEAVINISKEFVAMGWTVEVYCNCTKEGNIDGVNWYKATASNPMDNVDLSILWRHPHAVYNAPRGRVTWLWNHDLQDGMEQFYDEDTMARIDKVMFLSEFHRTTAPWVPDEKVMLTRNGVDPSLFVTGDNDPYTVVYASSPDRGLDTLLDYWPEISNAHPKARLKVFYGFNKWFDKTYQNNPEKLAWKQHQLDRMEKDPTITYHGSVGQDVLAKEIASSGVWAYPTHFGETSCITAMKMQCGGAVPVVTRYGALNDTVRFGHKMGKHLEPVFDKDEFIRTMISVVGNKQHQTALRVPMMSDTRTFFRWDKVAKEWEAEFVNCANLKYKELIN